MRTRRLLRLGSSAVLIVLSAAANSAAQTPTPASAPAAPAAPATRRCAPAEDQAKAALEKSPRHGEYLDVKDGLRRRSDPHVISYPERKDKAGVVILIQEVFGLTDWIRGVADQLAKEGFIAVAPDMISGLGPNGGGTDSVASRDDAVKLVRASRPRRPNRRLDAVRDWAISCRRRTARSRRSLLLGRARSFAYAAAQPEARRRGRVLRDVAGGRRPREDRRRRSKATTAATTRASTRRSRRRRRR
jgi:hypothetical protein